MNFNNVFRRNNQAQGGVPEIDVQGDDFTVRQPQGEEAELSEALALPEPSPVPAPGECKGKVPPHSWGV